jgi:phosphoenolpyruvate synthase/pyruvate phosphate dikinase
MLYEDEIVLCLEGKTDPHILLETKGKIIAYGYDETMTKRINFTEEESKELFECVEKQQTTKTDNTEIRKGITASTGKAKGKARIIMSHAENNKVQAGDIMITVATAIDFLPAMKNAAAIITEVGGLTCHAAVVCREFGIPCIVSLKNATKEFKDGDLVEVNADKGTVTILQRA